MRHRRHSLIVTWYILWLVSASETASSSSRFGGTSPLSSCLATSSALPDLTTSTTLSCSSTESSQASILSSSSNRILPNDASSVAAAATRATTQTRTPIVVVSTGLRNCGNTCYLASTLQCAFHIPLVRSLILQDPSLHQRQDKDTEDSMTTTSVAEPPTTSTPSTALTSLRQLFQNMLTSATNDAESIPSPLPLCQSLGIPIMEQHDSQEFWKLLLPALQSSTLTELYQGAYQDYILALDGSKREKRREEPFLDLSLDVSTDTGDDNEAYSIQTALQTMFGTPELLSVQEGNGWRPEKGAEPVNAHKGSLLVSSGLPSVLQLHLKRFQYDWNTDRTSKLNHPIEFPLELDLTDLCDDTKHGEGQPNEATSSLQTLYDLQAIVVHQGEYGLGHYYTYVRPDVRRDMWYRFNDHTVEQVTYEEVYRDACGGKSRTNPPSGSSSNQRQSSRNPFQWIQHGLRAILSSSLSSSYGFGGKTSNAYVLQYVRRSDIPMLYCDTIDNSSHQKDDSQESDEPKEPSSTVPQ